MFKRVWIHRLTVLAGLALASMVFAPSSLRADVPLTITQQGRLFGAAEQPVQGALSVTFALYDAQDATVAIWTETHQIAFEQGYFSVELGSLEPLDAALFDGSIRYLGIKGGRRPGDDAARAGRKRALRARGG